MDLLSKLKGFLQSAFLETKKKKASGRKKAVRKKKTASANKRATGNKKVGKKKAVRKSSRKAAVKSKSTSAKKKISARPVKRVQTSKPSVKKKSVKKSTPSKKKGSKKARPPATKKTASKKKSTVSKNVKKSGRSPSKETLLLVGEVTHFFSNVKAGVIRITEEPLILGETIFFKGATTGFKQKIKSMQINRKPVEMATVGDEIGIQVSKRVRVGDLVYKPII